MPRKNLKIPESLFLALRDDKGDNQSWPHYLETECLHDEAEGLGDIRSALSTLETRMGKIEQQLEEMERQLT